MGSRHLVFPLQPRQPVHGALLGAARSRRRGPGSDVVGTRPYRPGDDIRRINWRQSARLSAATGQAAMVVTEYYAEETPVVAVAVDRSRSMSLYPKPFLDKGRAADVARRLIVDSAAFAQAPVAYLEATPAGARWHPPQSRTGVEDLFAGDPGKGAALKDVLHELLNVRLPKGSFVFLISDFLGPRQADEWADVLGHGWELVPVVVQEPRLEASFPPGLHGVALPLVSADGRERQEVVLTRREARARQAGHEARRRQLGAELVANGLEPVWIDSADPDSQLDAFRAWADRRDQAPSVERGRF